MPEEVQAAILETLAERDSIRYLLDQDDETAGALVATEFIALRERMSVVQAQASIRASESLARRFSRLFVVNDSDRLAGSVSFRQLLPVRQAS